MDTISDLLGKTLASVQRSGSSDDNDDTITFIAEDGDKWVMGHSQDCCERVYIEDIVGDLSDLVGSPIVMAEEVSSEDGPPDSVAYLDEAHLWTYYRIASNKGTVSIRWLGTSNGYYSMDVFFIKED